MASGDSLQPQVQVGRPQPWGLSKKVTPHAVRNRSGLLSQDPQARLHISRHSAEYSRHTDGIHYAITIMEELGT